MSNGLPVGRKLCSFCLQRFRPHQFKLVGARIGRKVYAPAVGRAFPVKQVRPFRRIGNVIALGIAVPAEVVGDFDVQGAVVVGETLERDAEVLAHDAARAFAADQIAALDGFLFAGGVFHARPHAVGVLREGDEFRRQAQVDIGMRLGHRQRLFDDLDALALQHDRETACRSSDERDRTRRSACASCRSQ